MPPRVPVVGVFVAIYFAVAIGGGDAWLSQSVIWAPLSARALDAVLGVAELAPAGDTAVLRLTIAEALALAAASAAVLDAVFRPSRSLWDAGIASALAILAVTAMAYWPEAATPGYAVLVALALGDALGAWRGAARSRQRA